MSVTQAWRTKFLSRTTNRHILIAKNTTIRLSYGTKSGKFSSTYQQLTLLDAGTRALYKTHTLLYCLSSDELQSVLTMCLTDAQLYDHSLHEAP